MFWALAKGKVQAPGLQFEHILRDVETLNQWALEGRLECTAISAHAYAYVADRYAILSHGASMGDGYGPKVVSKRLTRAEDLTDRLIAIPGEMTSAFLALRLWWPGTVVREGAASLADAVRFRVIPFDRILDSVASGEVDAGLIIHEGQLTYADQGFHQIVDLGAWWHDLTGLPLPLGVNTIRKDLSPDVQRAASRALRDSIACGMENRSEALAYALQFARGLATHTADEFVGMYVNDWTLDMGEAGRESIRRFLGDGAARGFIPPISAYAFVE
jgi:1,4-dihydroxy-6-naphthoate synthase